MDNSLQCLRAALAGKDEVEDKGPQQLYRGRQFTADLFLRLKLEFALFDEDVPMILDQLLKLVYPEDKQ